MHSGKEGRFLGRKRRLQRQGVRIGKRGAGETGKEGWKTWGGGARSEDWKTGGGGREG